MTRLRWVAARKAEGFPTTRCCEAARVSRQAFYDWRARRAAGPSERERAEADLLAAIRGGACRLGRRLRVAEGDRAAARRGACGEPQTRRAAHESPSDSGDPPPAAQAHHHPSPHSCDAPGPAAPGLRARDPRSGVGVRHHLHPHRRGLAVPRSRARLGQPPAVGLPDERPHRRPLGPRRPQHGRRGPRGPHRRHRVPIPIAAATTRPRRSRTA